MSTASAQAVEVRGLGTRLGGEWLLRGLDLELHRGETLGVIGASGCGKSLLMRQMVGLQQPDEGHVEVLGEAVNELDYDDFRRLSRRWGVLFQQGALFSALSIYDNIAFPMRELRKDGTSISEAMIDDLVHVKLKMVGLEAGVAGKAPSELSGGMVKRAALARALALDAELLFLDEPTAGLDPASSSEFTKLYMNLRQHMGLSGFIVTHNIETLDALADRVAVLVDRRILTTGTLDEVANYDHPVTRQFFASTRRNSDRSTHRAD